MYRIDWMISKVIENPQIGERKTGILFGVKVRKISYNGKKYLIAFKEVPVMNNLTKTLTQPIIEFYQVGIYQGFYKKLENYLSSC